jgi:hypothetical protein
MNMKSIVVWRGLVVLLTAGLISSGGLVATSATAQSSKKMVRYGTRVDDAFTTLAALSDGTFVTGGYQDNNRGYWRTFVMRYSKSGKLLWKKNPSMEPYYTFEVSKQIVVAGEAAVAVAYSRSGKKLWRSKLATSAGCVREGVDSVTSAVSAADGPGFLALSNCEGWGSVESSILVDRYNSRGQLQWERSIPTRLFDTARTLTATRDGGYIIGGFIDNKNVPDCTSCSYTSPSNPVLAKFDAAGSLQWSYADDRSAPQFAGVGFTYSSITEISTGGYVALQHAEARDSSNSVLVRFDADGKKVWESSGSCKPTRVYHPDGQVLEIAGGFMSVGISGAGLCQWSQSGATQWGVAYKGVTFRAVAADRRGGFVAVGEASKRASAVAGKPRGGPDAVIGHFNSRGRLSAWR